MLISFYFPFLFPHQSLLTDSLTAVLTNLFSLQTCLINKLMHDPLAEKQRNHSERYPTIEHISGRNGNGGEKYLGIYPAVVELMYNSGINS